MPVNGKVIVPEVLRVIALDCWETLIHDFPELEVPRSELRISQVAAELGRLGHPADRADVARAYDAAGRQYERVWETDIEIDTGEQLTIMLEAINPDLPGLLDAEAWDAVTQAYVDPILTSPPVPADGVVETLDQLRAGGYRLGLICNTGRSPGWALRSLLDRFGILSRLDSVSFSNEEGLRKPRPEIFLRLLERLGASPAEAIHVGDDPRTDVGGAAAVGILPIMVGNRPATVTPAARIGTIRELPDAIERLRRDGILRSP